MGTYRLARHLPSPSLLMDTWAGLSEAGRPVLVLRRKEPWAQAPGFLERFAPWLRGWQALRQADGVLPLVEVGLAGNAVCVVQEFMEGEPLRLALLGTAPPGKTPFSVVESVAVMLQATRGLLALQQLSPPLVHGDVSATTLLLGLDGAVRFETIGVAAAQAADPALGPARSEMVCLAPEEAEGQRTPTTDVFRLGLVWLELLTGKTAFTGASWAEVKQRLEKFPGVTPGHFPSLPQPIPGVLAMMLAKSPAARPSVSDLEMMLTQAWDAVGGVDSVTAPLAAAFARLFPARPRTDAQLQGGTVLTVTAPSAGLAEGAVKLARISTKRMSADDVNASRNQEASEAAKGIARDWTNQHAGAEEKPADFALGATLLEQQRITVEQADAALQNSQSFGGTLFDSLCTLGAIDQDEALPTAAGLLKQAYLTGPQMLELGLGRAQAALLDRDIADNWQVIPLKLEAGGLTLAVLDPTRMAVLDDVKVRAKVRAITPVRATERTIREGFARIYEGKSSPPDWTKQAPALSASEPSPFDLSGIDLSLSPLGERVGERADARPPPPSLPSLPTAPTRTGPFEAAPFDLGDMALSFSESKPETRPPQPSRPAFAAPPPGASPPVARALAPPSSAPSPFGPPGASPPFAAPPPPRSAPVPGPAPSAPAPPPPRSAPVPVPAPSAPAPLPEVFTSSVAPLIAPPPSAPRPGGELAGSLDVSSRLLDALLSVMGERGLEASAMIALVRSVAKQAGATGAPLDQVRLSVSSVVIAALLEGKRAFEVPSRPATAACLGPHWREFQDFVRPLLDGDETLPSDPRGVVLSLCFEVANTVGAVPRTLADAASTLDTLRSRYPLAALAALEIVLASQ